ncbi:MAG: imidazole glycerol phosphate synthase subunit HisH [Bacteroidota bacterium]|nr:imidazole glycerol phosphate synthase subunit HisH [Bacteroidota bacterium]MDQ6888866.1 imidazole glycerol phosphate synthase subunit HisH [Bacteroidota bacterium]
MKIAIIKYNAGNVQSVLYALQRLGIAAVVTDNQDEIKAADKVIFPGVGNAGSAMQYLKRNGLDKVITSLSQPVLGICLGLQLMCDHSEEDDTKCLGIFNVLVKKFSENLPVGNSSLFKIPHIGWNTISNLSSPLFDGVAENSFVYHVHSYYAALSTQTIATTDYIVPYSSGMHTNNFYGVQFHTEKSALIGAHILSNFLKIV